MNKAKFKAIVHKLIVAELNDSWKGSGDPADYPRIARELALRRKRYKDAVDQLFHKLEEAEQCT